jgi:hypothetical protein
MSHDDDLTRELAALGRSVNDPGTPGLTTAVMDRVAGLPTPAPSRVRAWSRLAVDTWQAWRRRLTVLLVALLVALVVTPPVRATVAEWFGFAGVVVERGPDLGDDASLPPEVEGDTSLADAAELVGFAPLVPAELGPPEAVDVSADRVMVSLGWSADEGPLRLDQFDGRLDFTIAKTSPGVVYVSVGGTDALWFERPHEVVVLDGDNRRREESARLAGHTLIWPVGDLTMRLEGDVSLERAVEIAASAAPYDE